MSGMALMAVTAISLYSCAEDGYDDSERFNGVTNTTLASPSVDDIAVTPSADGKKQTITWPVVKGAGGYKVSLIDLANPESPIIKDSLVDGCSVTASRDEDVNYQLSVLTMANEAKNNKGAETPTVKLYNTFAPAYASLPSGTNLNEYFAANPLPADSIGKNLIISLEGDGEYYVSDNLSFGLNTVTLRSTSKTKLAKIIFTGNNSGFSTQAGLTLKYLYVDGGQSLASFIALDKSPSLELYNGKYYFIEQPISVLNCRIENLCSMFFFDNKVKTYMPTTVLVDNCLVHLTTSPDASDCISGAYFWTNKGNGLIKDLTINNSTFYNTTDAQAKYFVQYGGEKPKNVAEKWQTSSINYQNSTFYNVCPTGQWGNYNGVAGQTTSYWNMTSCIFYNCSTSGVARRFLAGRGGQSTATFLNNTYMKPDGTFDDPGNYDKSGTDIKEDPMFADPANGDFTISGATQLRLKTGDPRWLPKQ